MVEEKNEKMETNDAVNGEEKANGDTVEETHVTETEEKDSAKTPAEWKLSNLDREKAATTVDKEGIPKFYEQGRTKSDNATIGVVKIVGYEDDDLTNPYIYAAFANAARASIEFTHPAPDVPNKNWAAYKNKKALRLQFKNDGNARMMAKNLLNFVRTPGGRELTITRFVNSGQGTEHHKEVEVDGKVFDVPRPMRSLIVRGVAEGATIKQIVKALSTREADLELHELRKDARGKQCAVLCFKDAAKAITVMQRTEGTAKVGDTDVLVYYMAAGMFYDNLLHYSEAEGRDIEAAYANLMHGVSRANNPSMGEQQALKRAGLPLDGTGTKKAKGPANLATIKPAQQRPRFVAEGANPAQAKRMEAMAKKREREQTLAQKRVDAQQKLQQKMATRAQAQATGYGTVRDVTQMKGHSANQNVAVAQPVTQGNDQFMQLQQVVQQQQKMIDTLATVAKSQPQQQGMMMQAQPQAQTPIGQAQTSMWTTTAAGTGGYNPFAGNAMPQRRSGRNQQQNFTSFM